MDVKLFWIIGLLIITFGGSVLTFARRYGNEGAHVGRGVAGWTMVALIIWVFVGAANLLPK